MVTLMWKENKSNKDTKKRQATIKRKAVHRRQ